MKVAEYPTPKELAILLKRPAQKQKHLYKSVRKIMKNVKKNGDKALYSLTESFDGVRLNKLRVDENEIMNAAARTEQNLKDAILVAKRNIELFHSSVKETSVRVETMPGISCWRRSAAIEKVGLYIPGGSAPLFSTVLMLAIPASLAGCKEIILCTPPLKNGNVHPAILYAANICGVTAIFKCGGAQAIAAMTYGTKTIPAVQKLFGPGNNFVTAAKVFAQQEGIAIDIPAGPSEVLIIADHTARPSFVAADLLAQAEHGPDSQVILVCTTKEFADLTLKSVKKQLSELPRKAIAKEALSNSCIIIVRNIHDALTISNQYAPEHLILNCENAENLAQHVTAAGSVFLGPYSPESAGDYASGTNHTLPTNGFAAAHSGVSIETFEKKITFQELTTEGLKRIGQTVKTMAAAEGLEGHKRAVEIRLNS